MLPWSNPLWHKSLTYGMVRTRGLVYCPALSAVTWQVPLAAIHNTVWTASYPFCHSCALLFTLLGQPVSTQSPLTQPICSFSSLVSVLPHSYSNLEHVIPLSSSCNWYVLPAWQDSAPLMIFNAPFPLPVTFSHFSHNSCLLP